MNSYFVVNLEDVNIEESHPYTLVFEGYIPTYGSRRYTFKYDGDIVFTNSMISENIKKDFTDQLLEDYGCGIKFDLKKVKAQLKQKPQYRMKIK